MEAILWKIKKLCTNEKDHFPIAVKKLLIANSFWKILALFGHLKLQILWHVLEKKLELERISSEARSSGLKIELNKTASRG